MWERVLEAAGRVQDRLLLRGPPRSGEEVVEEEEDEDVAAEKARVLGAEEAGPSTWAIVLKRLSKTYRQTELGGGCGKEGLVRVKLKKAVRGVTLGIPHAECFGFLG